MAEESSWSARTRIGLAALTLLGVAGAFWVTSPGGNHQTSSVLVRVAVVLGALWLALPELKRVPRIGLAGLLLATVIVAVQPRLFLLAIAALVAFAFLRPRLTG